MQRSPPLTSPPAPTTRFGMGAPETDPTGGGGSFVMGEDLLDLLFDLGEAFKENDSLLLGPFSLEALLSLPCRR